MTEKHHGKKRVRRRYGRSLTMVLAFLMLLGLCIGGSVAFLLTGSREVTNTFQPAHMACHVEETMDKEASVKSNVYVKNDSNVPAYIRVKLLFNWRDAEGENMVAQPAWGQSSSISLPEGSKWELGSDGFFYYKDPVEAKGNTEKLIDEIPLGFDPVTGSKQSLEIVASCVQAEPDDAVLKAWGEANGSVTSVDLDNTLRIHTGGDGT